MDRQLTILLNEYSAIKDFRERCIRNIEETTRTYLIFLGFGATAISVIIERDISSIYPMIVLFICMVVGISIYKLNIESHINFINYTRKLNKTRSLFIKYGINKKNLVLPTDKDSPPFDRIGFTGKKFSKDGVLKLIQIMNSIVAFGFMYFFFIGIEEITFFPISVLCKISLSLLFALFVLYYHAFTNCKLIEEAESQWKSNKNKK